MSAEALPAIMAKTDMAPRAAVIIPFITLSTF
jgi:hypothetical protein